MNIIFTIHAEDRIVKRKIAIEEVINAIKFPDSINKKHGKYYFKKTMQRGTIEICCERTERDINAEKCNTFLACSRIAILDRL